MRPSLRHLSSMSKKISEPAPYNSAKKPFLFPAAPSLL